MGPKCLCEFLTNVSLKEILESTLSKFEGVKKRCLSIPAMCRRICLLPIVVAVAVPPCDVDGDFSGPDPLEDGDGLGVRQPVGGVPVHRQNFITYRKKMRKLKKNLI